MSTVNSQLNSGVSVYVAKFDESVEVREVQPALRNEAIQRCKDKLTRQQRYCVWRLLDYALKRQFGKGVEDFNFTVEDNGKWRCDSDVYFSLSHCDNVVAVAVSRKEIGVDIEAVESFTHHATDCKFIERVLTDDEMGSFESISPEQQPQALAEMWTQKESLFKLAGGMVFVPKTIDTLARQVNCQVLQIDGKDYALAVAMVESGAVQTHIVEDKTIFN